MRLPHLSLSTSQEGYLVTEKMNGLTLLLLLQTVANAFYLPNQSILSRAPIRQTRINAGPADFLSTLFKDSKKVSAKRLAKAETLKQSLRDITKGTSNGIKATDDVRSKVAKIVKDLELLNDVKSIGTSPIMNGNWKLMYTTTNDGPSSGRLGPFIGRVDQDVDVTNTKYINGVRLGGGIVQGALTATWDNLGPKLWTVKFLNIEIKLFGIAVLKKSLLGTEGTWQMTYLDKDIRVLYATGKRNPEANNLYILESAKY